MLHHREQHGVQQLESHLQNPVHHVLCRVKHINDFTDRCCMLQNLTNFCNIRSRPVGLCVRMEESIPIRSTKPLASTDSSVILYS